MNVDEKKMARAWAISNGIIILAPALAFLVFSNFAKWSFVVSPLWVFSTAALARSVSQDMARYYAQQEDSEAYSRNRR